MAADILVFGTGNFAGPYLIDAKDGKSHYNLKDERGTILRVAPDLSKREIVCTGGWRPTTCGCCIRTISC